MMTLRADLDSISGILQQTFAVEPFKRDYDMAFSAISEILRRYGVVENSHNLRFQFILCMQEFFDAIPQNQWRVKDPVFVKQSEEFAIAKFRQWILGQVT